MWLPERPNVCWSGPSPKKTPQKLTSLSHYELQDNHAGMAVILTDQKIGPQNCSTLSDEKEPFLYIVNVGENQKRNGSC